MRLLVLGIDPRVLDQSSTVYKRIRYYATAVEWYEVVVPSKKRIKIVDGNLTVIGTGGFNKIDRLCRMIWYTWFVIPRHSITVLSSQDTYFIGAAAVLLGALRRVGVEIQVHGLEKFNIIRKELADFALKRADSIRVVSKDFKKRIQAYFGIDNNKITIAPIFVDWKAIQYTKFDHRIKDATKEHIVFLAIGRMVPIKNFEGIIRAFSHVYQEYPQTHLLLLGDGPLKPKLMADVREMGIEEAVEFVGWVDNVIEYYRGSHCGVFFSESEGYGMALIEALACQLPVITTKVGVAQDVVQDGVNGLFVDKGDVESLERLMKLMVVNDSLRQDMRQYTRQGLEQLPTQQEVLDQYMVSWKKVLQATKSKQR